MAEAKLYKGFQALLESLPVEGREQLLSEIRSREVCAGTVLASRDNPCEVVAIASGEVSVRMPVQQGLWMEIGRCGPGDILGLETFVEGSNDPIEVVALGSCRLEVVDAASFGRLLARFPCMYLGVTRILSRRLEAAQAILVERRLKPRHPIHLPRSAH